MNNKGFTLVEVLVVIGIIAIVGLIATPSVLSLINSSKDSTYKILVDNIRTAAEELYQEVDYMNTNIYVHTIEEGRTPNILGIVDDKITVNLQTLVGNGFLSATSNEDLSNNKNNKVILEPYDKKDIGSCEISVEKIKIGLKVCYKIVGVSSEARCPTTLDFGGDNQCKS